jgi:hypothetical protein
MGGRRSVAEIKMEVVREERDGAIRPEDYVIGVHHHRDDHEKEDKEGNAKTGKTVPKEAPPLPVEGLGKEIP